MVGMKYMSVVRSRVRGEDPQAAPVGYPSSSGGSGALKVDRVVRVGDHTLVAGWRSEEVELALATPEGKAPSRVFSTRREDVAEHLGKSPDEELGFVLLCPSSDGQLELTCGGEAQETRFRLAVEPGGDLDANAAALLMPALAVVMTEMDPASEEWRMLVGKMPALPADDRMAGAFDRALGPAGLGRAMVVGWATVPDGAIAWVQDDGGRVHHLQDAFRMHRDDVRKAYASHLVVPVQHRPGFCLVTEGVEPGTRLRLRAFDGAVVRELAEVTVEALSSDLLEASRELFSTIATPMSRIAERFSAAESVVLDAMVARDRELWKRLPVRVQNVGTPVQDPNVSIVIPLYGRSDFVEHQMAEFVRDGWLARHAELIYVLDDRALVDRFIADAYHMHRLYRLPMTIVWGGVNRGFAGANNLGAQYARARHLLFMNSDVFPREPGWLQPLLDVLDTHPDVGVVAPKLLFADGSIQHAGMEFQERPEWGIWINHHPHMGLDPSLDPNAGLTVVPAVTGACMALRREHFDRVDGWDTGYLVGDFEDSDLCLKLRSIGLKSAYLADVSLTHLERQSFRLLGAGDYRTKVVIHNALRHQKRWSGALQRGGMDEAGALTS